MPNKNLKKGFTLVEMLVVVLMLGILAGMATVGYFTTLEKSRAREAINILRHWQAARAIYFAEAENTAAIESDPNATLTRLQIDSNITNNKYFTCTPQTSSIVCTRNNNNFSIVANDSHLYCCWSGVNNTSSEKLCTNLSGPTNTIQGQSGLPANNTCVEIIE